ncbi:MAG TPA: aminotransferase class V-fold PLP-dependent enzyme [Pseudonocardiaceae bacterium]|nr:aminotransferase class V-fold PLP-dependent enzyme [Pseudonocardiaceae bacterium]
MTGIDVDAVRADTPAATERIFLDSAGSSLPPNTVLETVVGHLRREAEVGGYRAVDERQDDLASGYQVFADLLGCEPDEVAFSDSATRSWLSLMDSVPLAEGDRILIGQAEYAANAISLLRRAEEAGAKVETIPSDGSGALSVAALRDMLDERVRLVSLVHVPTNGGLVNPVREVVEAAHDVGALVLLDACQSIGQRQVNVRELGVDLLSGTGRKWLRGPRGTGFAVARREIAHRLRPRLLDHHGATWVTPDQYELNSDASVYELWETDVAGRLGLIEAARYALRLGMDRIADRVAALAELTRRGLAEIPGVDVRDLGSTRCGLVTFTMAGRTPAELRAALWDRGITVTATPPGTALIDTMSRGLDDGVLRSSAHYFVTEDEVDRFVAEVARLSGWPGSCPRRRNP